MLYKSTKWKIDISDAISEMRAFVIGGLKLWTLIMREAESYTSGLIHEAFHGFQGSIAIEKFSKAEFFAQKSNEYP